MVSNMSELLAEILMPSKMNLANFPLNLNQVKCDGICTSYFRRIANSIVPLTNTFVTFYTQTNPLYANLDAQLLHQLLTTLVFQRY
jgi:hypothetical protein